MRSPAIVYERIKGGAESTMEDFDVIGERRTSLLLVRGCEPRRAKITSSLSACINLCGRGMRDQVDPAYFVCFERIQSTRLARAYTHMLVSLHGANVVEGE